MTMRVTMRQSRYGAGGALLAAGSTYSVSDEFGAALVGWGFATDTDGVLSAPRKGRQPLYVDPATGVVSDQDGNPSSVSGAWNYIRWCIPGRDTSGTVFKDVSGKGNDGTIEASNAAPFATDNRISTAAHASAGGVVVPLAATTCDLATDSFVMAFALTNEDPASAEIVASFGAGPVGGVANAPGVYLSHRSAAAGVARMIWNKGNSTVVSGTDSTVKISNAGGTRETHCLMAWDAPTKSSIFYRDGVVAIVDNALMTAANAFTSTVVTLPARLGGIGGAQQSFAGIYRGWQGYVFAGKGLPVNIGRIAAILAEAPSVPLNDSNFAFA